MKKTSIIKIARDLLREKQRTITVILAMILGVFSVSVMVTSRDLLNQNLKDNYRKTNPASFTLVLDSLTDDLRKELIELPEIEDVEIRQMVLSRFPMGENSYLPIFMFLIEDFDHLRIGKFSIDAGRFPKSANEMVIERTGDSLTDLNPGEIFDITIPGMKKVPLKLTGIVHDPGQAPSAMERILYGYVQRDFASKAFIDGLRQQVNFTVSQNKYSFDHIAKVTGGLIKKLENKGYKVYSKKIPPPGEHKHASQMDAFMFLLMMFGILVLLLSFFLIINMISAIMAKEIRQIGIMKAIGANTRHITSIYLTIVLILGVIATAIGTPLGIMVGIKYAEFNVGLLNFTLFERQISFVALLLILFMGIILPAIIATLPILRSSRISVQEALNDYGVSESATQENSWYTTLFKKLGASNSFIFSWRNAFRRKVRLALTLVPIVLGGAIFISAFNVQTSSQQTVEETFANKSQDLAIRFASAYPEEELGKVIESTRGFSDYAFGNLSTVTILDANGLESNAAIIPFMAIDVSSKILNPQITEGVWFSSGKDNFRKVVINSPVASKYPELKVGGNIKLTLNGGIETFSIIGVVKEQYYGPAIYIDNEHYTQISNNTGLANTLIIDMGNPDVGEVNEYSNTLEAAFESKSLEVRIMVPKERSKKGIVAHLVLMYNIFIILSFMMLLVGGLGIITTMGMNIIERRREIGILRALGVTDKGLYKTLIYEGLSIGLISWLLSVLLSIPVSYYLGNKFYDLFFSSSVIFTVSSLGLIAWLFINTLLSIVALLIPARRTIALSVNTAIAYE